MSSVKFTPKQLAYLQRTFPELTLDPRQTHIDEIWYNAGVQAVLKFIEARTDGPKLGLVSDT